MIEDVPSLIRFYEEELAKICYMMQIKKGSMSASMLSYKKSAIKQVIKNLKQLK